MPALDVGNRHIEYSVIRGTGRRYTYFRFGPDNKLEVVLPRGRKVDVEREIRSRLGWIVRQSERLASSRNVLGPNEVMFGGKVLEVRFVKSLVEEFRPNLERSEVLVRSSDPRAVRELVRRWFLTETSSYVVKKVASLAPEIGVRPTRVDVREINKWGYCTRGGRLSFSWQLAALSESLREYVVLHELTHLREFNHSAAFRRRLARFCPDFRLRERELDLVVPYDRLGPPS